MKSSTMKQIAKELGISVSTVSRALNGKTVVKEDTRQLVLETAKKYSYTPNEIARSLQKSSTQTIAVVLPDISEVFFGTIVKEIDRVLARQGYMLILADTHERRDKEQKYLDMLYTRRVDALVLATVDCEGGSVERFLASKTPVVFIDNVPELDGVDAITTDNEKASKLAVDYLFSHGHRSIAAIIGSKEETTGKERLAGYERAMKENDLMVDERLIMYGDYKQDTGYSCMKQLLARREEAFFSAVYVTSEKMTYGAMNAIYECGLSVPEDISVIGFDIHMAGFEQLQRITTIRQPEESIGQKTGELLLARLGAGNEDREEIEGERIFLEPYLEEGTTVKEK